MEFVVAIELAAGVVCAVGAAWFVGVGLGVMLARLDLDR